MWFESSAIIGTLGVKKPGQGIAGCERLLGANAGRSCRPCGRLQRSRSPIGDDGFVWLKPHSLHVRCEAVFILRRNAPDAKKPRAIILTTFPIDMPNSIDSIPVEGHQVDPALVREIAGLVVSALNLDIDPDQIDPSAPLYGEGLGLDSIDILEVALVASKRYGFKLKDEDRDNMRIFSSLNNLALHVAERRTK